MKARELDRLIGEAGELIAKEQRSRGQDFSPYERDPEGFIRDVLGGDPWPRQVEIAEVVRDHPQVTVRSCHAAGKDWLAARLALWWVYAKHGLVILTGPTAAQVEEILMRREVRAPFVAGGLSGDLHVRALRPGWTGEAGIIAKTGSGVHGMTGLHEARVLFIITEAQDPDIAHAWDAAFACATGADDRILTLGNPTEPDGRFYRAHQPGSGWHSIKIAAEDVPNVQQGRTVVPGLLTREGVDRFVREYGEGSPVVISRVHAEFPAEATDSLIQRAWWDRAVEMHQTCALEYDATGAHYILGVDPARLGPDRSVVCIRQGPVVRSFVHWSRQDTMQTADRIEAEVRRLLEDYTPQREGGGVEAVYVDEVGVGGGVLDRLQVTLPRVRWTRYLIGIVPKIRTQHVRAEPFNAARSAHLSDRFSNLRAQGYWHLRKAMEDGRLALPKLEELGEELLATRVRFGADGRTSIEPKDQLKERLGRSPDYADALVISLAPMLQTGKRRVRIV